VGRRRNGDRAHVLVEAGRGALDDARRGLRGDVARRESGAARRQDELGRGRELAQSALDAVGLVGHGAPLGEVEPRGDEPVREEITAQILAGAGRNAVGHRQDGSPHGASRRQSPLFPPDFSTSLMCSIEEFGSSPFVMS